MMQWTYEMPTKIIVGKGCIGANSQLLRAMGKKAYIITGRHSAKQSGALDAIREALKVEGIDYCVFGAIEENPSLETLECAKNKGLEAQVDFVIGIGGGSPLDASKGIAVMLAHQELGAHNLIGDTPLDGLPVIAIPTTAGTGSEVTPYAIFTDHKAQTKRNFGHRIFPQIAYLDASYMMAMPDSVTIQTAVDAFSHLAESYLNVKSNLMSELFVEKGIRLWADCLGALQNKTFTYEVREKLLLASTFAGMAITQTGTSLPHTMGYGLTYHKGMPHGIANAVLYGAYFRSFKDQTRVQQIIEWLGLKNQEAFEETLTRLIGAPDCSVTDEEIKLYTKETMVNKAKLMSHPEEVTEESIYKLYKASLKLQ